MRGKTGKDKVEHINTLINNAGTIIEYNHGHNLIIKIKGIEPGPILAITAHHDNVHPDYENCLDNTASVINLTKIYQRLADKPPKHDVILAWTDHEETCSLEKTGIRSLIETNNIDYLLDLELTASGSIPLLCEYGKFDFGTGKFWDDIIISKMPYNNAYAAKAIGGIRGSACLTIVSESDMHDLRLTGYCKRWSQCHQSTDTFERWYSVVETEYLINCLVETLY